MLCIHVHVYVHVYYTEYCYMHSPRVHLCIGKEMTTFSDLVRTVIAKEVCIYGANI